jgi:hypothetical protein
MAAQEKNPVELGKAKQLNHVPWSDEYEKMISGMLYFLPVNYDPALANIRHQLQLPRVRPSSSPLQSPRLGSRIQHRTARSPTPYTIPPLLTQPQYFPPASSNPDFDSLAADRMDRLRAILGHVGEDAFIEPPFRIDYGCNISLGNRFYANFNLTILDCSLVTIGERVMFGPNVSIFAATHETEVDSRRQDIEYGRPVVIG